MLINAGIKDIIYREGYADPMATELLEIAGIRPIKI